MQQGGGFISSSPCFCNTQVIFTAENVPACVACLIYLKSKSLSCQVNTTHTKPLCIQTDEAVQSTYHWKMQNQTWYCFKFVQDIENLHSYECEAGMMDGSHKCPMSF